nr:H-NS histone family protein [uncultured Roseateles sp.]
MNSLHELLAQKAALDTQKAALEEQIAEARRRERADLIAKIEALMLEAGLTVGDLPASVHGTTLRGSSVAVRKSPSPAPAAKVSAKYRHPSTGETWSGLGLQPRWLKAAVASGAKLTDFAV